MGHLEMWKRLLLDWTVVAVLEVAEEVAITTSLASMKASW